MGIGGTESDPPARVTGFEPGQLAGRKIRVDRQPGTRPGVLFQRLQIGAPGAAAAVLPDDRPKLLVLLIDYAPVDEYARLLDDVR